MHNVRHFFRWLKTTASYAHFLWRNGHDWDYGTLLELMQFKISRMRTSVCGQHSKDERVVRQMRVAEILLGRILSNDYCTPERDEYDKRWGHYTRAPFDDGGFLLSRAHIKTDADKVLADSQARDLMARETAAMQRDYDYLFAHLRRRIQRWWC